MSLAGNKVSIFLLMGLLLVGCGDLYKSQIGGSKFHYVDWGDNHQFILLKGSDDVVSVPSTVLYYKNIDGQVVVARQPTRSYECDEKTIASIYVQEIEYWVLGLKSESVSGPLDYSALVKKVVALRDNKSVQKELFEVDMIEAPSILEGCTNPVLISE